MAKYKKPDLGTDYSGIETIKKYVKKMQADYEHSHIEDVLGYVLWILDDYKNMKQGDGTNFSRITASPEVLAEYLSNISTMLVCEIIGYCDKCPLSEKCEEEPLGDGDQYEVWLAWLKQESE